MTNLKILALKNVVQITDYSFKIYNVYIFIYFIL